MPSPTRPQRNYRWYDADLERIERIRRHLESLTGTPQAEVEAIRYALTKTALDLPVEKPVRKKSTQGT